MGIVDLLLIGIGLSMDAFAVSLCKGLGMKRLDMRQAIIIGVFFGGFQALMPVIGWVLGKQFESYITSIDHWIAFALLAFIGGKMIFDALRGVGYEEPAGQGGKLDYKELFMLAIATSIDALAVGITFAFLQVGIAGAVSIIGITTFLLSVAGVAIGHQFGVRFEKPASIVGGVVLILIGVRILLEHLGIIAF
ncbi:MAG: manganese efflux pump MntP family protein [Eggerthellaceae bacterium]|nr:manganese efflux pump MntP family protein [Eggerthellaceae bacterium]